MADPAAPTPTSLQAQITSLQHLLSTLHQTRSSLPSLLRGFSSIASNPNDQAGVYRAASNHVTQSIRTLNDELQPLESVLAQAESSALADGKGIRVKQSERKAEGEGLERLASILGTSTTDIKGKGRETAFNPKFGDISTPAELEDVVKRWGTEHTGKLQLELIGKVGREPHQLRLKLKGVMSAVLALYWTRREGDDRRVCYVERVSCYGLKEEKASYLASQFTLHNNITRAAMEVVESSRLQTEKEGDRSNVEELLVFLSDPPLPF